jgi:hypothetical protein
MSPIDRTLDGTLMALSTTQLAKAPYPIVATLLGTVSVLSETHPLKARSPIVFRLDGKVTLVISALSAKALSPKAVTGLPPNVEGTEGVFDVPVYPVTVALVSSAVHTMPLLVVPLVSAAAKHVSRTSAAVISRNKKRFILFSPVLIL